MKAKSSHRPQPLPSAYDQAHKMAKQSKQFCMTEIDIKRNCSLIPEYWNEVQYHAEMIYKKADDEQKAKDEFYRNALTPSQRQNALVWVDDNFHDPVSAFKEIRAHINMPRSPSDRTYWMYIQREFNIRRYGGGGGVND